MRIGAFILILAFGTIAATAQSSPVYHITSEFEGINAEQEHYNDLYAYTQVLEDPTDLRRRAYQKRCIRTKYHPIAEGSAESVLGNAASAGSENRFLSVLRRQTKSLIQESANKQAIHYLTQFSKFIRNVLQHSEVWRITLEEELDMSRLYLEMEKLRFEKSFNYKITIAPDVDTSFVQVPPMILQPFLENAIWHGLMHKNDERILHLEICREGENVKCIVEDNGIGREHAAVLKAGTRPQDRSFSTRLIADRLKINKELFDSNFVIILSIKC